MVPQGGLRDRYNMSWDARSSCGIPILILPARSTTSFPAPCSSLSPARATAGAGVSPVPLAECGPRAIINRRSTRPAGHRAIGGWVSLPQGPRSVALGGRGGRGGARERRVGPAMGGGAPASTPLRRIPRSGGDRWLACAARARLPAARRRTTDIPGPGGSLTSATGADAAGTGEMVTRRPTRARRPRWCRRTGHGRVRLRRRAADLLAGACFGTRAPGEPPTGSRQPGTAPAS